jgi:hypothetical protein
MMKEHNRFLHEELISKVLHPTRIYKFLLLGYDLDDL